MNKTKDIQLSLRRQLLEEIESRLSVKKTQKQFFDTFMKTALTNPKSYASQRMIDIMLPVNSVEAIDIKNSEQSKADVSLQQFRLHQALYDKQNAVIDCVGKNRNILCLTSRRCGKSVLDAAAIVWTALEPNTPILYLNITYKQALNQILDNLERFAEVAGLKIIKTDKTDGLVKFENGSTCWIGSNTNKASADKYRGFKFKLIIIDEIGHMSNLDYLLDEVLYPAQVDFKQPTILMTGTPSRIPHHFSTEMFSNETNGVKKFNWCMLDNPYLPDPQAAIEEVCRRKGISKDNAFIQREYYGQFVADTEALVIPKRTYRSDQKMSYDGIIIGVDYGYIADNAIIAVGYNQKQGIAETIEELSFDRSAVSDTISKIEQCYNRMRKLTDNVIIYCDNNEQSITADLRKHHNLPAFDCYKYDKAYALEVLSDMCRTGKMRIEKDGVLDREMEQTLYSRDEDDNIIPVIDDEIFHPNALFALLYASRRVFVELGYDVSWKMSDEEAKWIFVSDENGSRWVEHDKMEDYIVIGD